MIIVAQCLGLQVSEIVALVWSDFDFDNQSVSVQRSIVHGRIGAVKTEYSRDVASTQLLPDTLSIVRPFFPIGIRGIPEF